MDNIRLKNNKGLNSRILGDKIRIEIPLIVLRKILGYPKKVLDHRKDVLENVKGMWQDKEMDALEYQNKIRQEWK